MSANNQPPLAERSDIHKSCKSIENLLSVFNDYCEALGAIAALQKKLSKALRETAGMKVTGEIAANALHASATIFESLNEVDSKFAKLADKEYDAISEEVKKWFKKLMKEEKAHDERIVAANNKIKQAGQIYEKKAKKGPREANEEHVRYINLISAMGPEISQEKYNHSLLVSQRHTSTTYNIAACVSRIADAEWMKACEAVRRFSPTIGKLGEWRALCEGGWTGSVPQDLPDIENPRETVDHNRLDEDDRSQVTIKGAKSEPEQIQAPDAAGNYTGASTPTFEGSAEGTFGQQPPQRQYSGYNDSPGISGNKTGGQSAPPTSFNLSNRYQDDTTGSVRSLSAFPSPPTHYPLPPSMTQRQQQQQPSQSTSQSSSTSHITFPSSNRAMDLRPPSEPTEESAAQSHSPGISPGASPSASPVRVKFQDRPQVQAEVVEEPVSDVKSSPQISSRPKPVRAETLDPSTYRNAELVDMPSPSVSRTQGRGDYLSEEPTTPPTPSHRANTSLDGGRPNKIERTDTGTSSGSIVAAMRNRYPFNSGSSSPPLTKDIPRLPQSVSNLASKYDRPVSPPGARPLPSIDTATRPSRETSYREREREPTVMPSYRSTSNPTSTPSADEDLVARRRHQQRMEQMAEMELKEKEQELKRREHDIEERARELEQERANLLQTVNASSGLDISQPPRQRQLSFQQDQLRRPYSTYGDTVASPVSTSPVSPRLGGTAPLRPHSQYSTSATHLVPPASSSSRYPYRSGDEEFTSERTLSSRDPSVTSVTSTSVTSSPVMPSPRTEKKGWMRRLSMPIVAGNAFLEGKKHGSSNSFGGGKAGLLSLDSRKNGSNTYLKGGTVGEDGRLSGGLTSPKNYELGSGISNRSVTNLNGRR
ncbi:hypothetical protein L218DRAFT_995378 [Marasmius fiardii PR-910]|nr:hypothetical protein L218DRAFT_995378 [Marasmius fiardii PR-910]